MSSEIHPLDYQSPQPQPRATLGSLLRFFSLLMVVAGLITAVLGTVGADHRLQIAIGWLIVGFGITWAMLGQILHVLEVRA